MHRLLPLIPPVVGALIAGLLFAHDATWAIVVGLVVAVVSVLLAIAAAEGRFKILLAFVGTGALAIGTAAAATGIWLVVFGTEATATVSSVHAYDGGKGVGAAEDYTLRLADGSEVSGPLRQYEPGSYHVGDRVRVDYDPTGVIRYPVVAGNAHNTRDAVGGPIAMVVGLGLLVATRRRTSDSRTSVASGR